MTEAPTGTKRPRVLLLSHAPITRTSSGWLTKNRVGMIADGLAELGWDVTVLATSAPALSFLTHPFSTAVHVVPLSVSPRRLLPVIRLVRQVDAALVFTPVVRTALFSLVLGRRALVYAGNA